MFVNLSPFGQDLRTILRLQHLVHLRRPAHSPGGPTGQFRKEPWIPPIGRRQNRRHWDQPVGGQHPRIRLLLQQIVHQRLLQLERPTLGQAIHELLSRRHHDQGWIEFPQLAEKVDGGSGEAKRIRVFDVVRESHGGSLRNDA